MLRKLEGLSCVQVAENHKNLVLEGRKNEGFFFVCHLYGRKATLGNSSRKSSLLKHRLYHDNPRAAVSTEKFILSTVTKSLSQYTTRH
jgi:hypothetical protein